MLDYDPDTWIHSLDALHHSFFHREGLGSVSSPSHSQTFSHMVHGNIPQGASAPMVPSQFHPIHVLVQMVAITTADLSSQLQEPMQMVPSDSNLNPHLLMNSMPASDMLLSYTTNRWCCFSLTVMWLLVYRLEDVAQVDMCVLTKMFLMLPCQHHITRVGCQHPVGAAWDPPTAKPSWPTIPMGLYHSKHCMCHFSSFQNQMTLHSPSSLIAPLNRPTLSKLPTLTPLTTTLTMTIPILTLYTTVNITILLIEYWLGLLAVAVRVFLSVGGVKSQV